MDIHNFWLFALTSLMLNITPGNDMLFVATRSTSQGIKAGIVSSLGIMAGCMVHIIAAVVALFFLAFLPQFIDMNGANTHWQILFLGTWFNVGGTLVNILVAVLFGKLGNWLSRSPRFIRMQERLTGLILVALGIKVALSSKK